MTMLPLGFCRCYIKTARKHVQHRKKGFEDDSSALLLRSVCWICWILVFNNLFDMFRRLVFGVDWQCPGPITWQSDSVKKQRSRSEVILGESLWRRLTVRRTVTDGCEQVCTRSDRPVHRHFLGRGYVLFPVSLCSYR